MTSTSTSAADCPNCGTKTNGRFCAQCGSPVDGAACAGCRTTLTPGAKFCHRCGTPAGGQPSHAASSRSTSAALPWAFAAIALLAFGAYVAAQRFSEQRPVAPGAGPVAAGPMAGAPFAGGAAGPAPDISNLSPEQRADLLFNKIMAAYEEGNSEYVQNMSPMAIAAYGMLPAMDPLRRYDMGRLLEVTGALDLAEAQADTLLKNNPKHLLGLVLAGRIADLKKDEARRAELARQLVAAAPAELALDRPEYDAHQNDINIALTEARRRSR